MLARLALGLMWLLRLLPQAVLAALGNAFGMLLYALAHERRRVCRINLERCLPQMAAPLRRSLAPSSTPTRSVPPRRASSDSPSAQTTTPPTAASSGRRRQPNSTTRAPPHRTPGTGTRLRTPCERARGRPGDSAGAAFCRIGCGLFAAVLCAGPGLGLLQAKERGNE